MPQEEIDRLLVQYGTGGRTVVRLKGGDPFVFGRGGEEALVLREAGIPFEVVPGITAGIAAPAYAGIPVTHRELASGRRVRHRPREPGQARDGAGLARAGRVPGHARLLHGREGAAADRRAADRGRAPAGRAGRGRRARDAAGAEDGRCRRLGEIGSVEGIRAPGDHAGRAGRGAARADRLAGDAAAVRAHRGGHARAGAGVRARRAAARARRGGRRGAGDPHAGAGRARCRTCAPTTCCA